MEDGLPLIFHISSIILPKFSSIIFPSAMEELWKNYGRMLEGFFHLSFHLSSLFFHTEENWKFYERYFPYFSKKFVPCLKISRSNLCLGPIHCSKNQISWIQGAEKRMFSTNIRTYTRVVCLKLIFETCTQGTHIIFILILCI